MKFRFGSLGLLAIGLLCACSDGAQSPPIMPPQIADAREPVSVAAKPAPPAPIVSGRDVPARVLPIPDTISPQMQAIVAEPMNTRWQLKPETAADWKTIVDKASQAAMTGLPKLRADLGVTVVASKMGGVPVFILTPKSIAAKNAHRILINLHGGIRVFGPGESGTSEAIFMAGLTGYKVIAVDYRMPPDHPFPAAVDDGLAVYREVLRSYDPKHIGMFGASAGGSLTLTTLLKARMERLPMPGAIALSTPTVDLTKTGDSLYTNAFVDSVLVTQDGFIRATGYLYANGRDLKDPLISPIYGDVHGFPPAILVSGTRDLYLSNTVRMHRKLRAAGIDAQLHVFEGLSHNHWIRDSTAPETIDYHKEVAQFFDQHLKR